MYESATAVERNRSKTVHDSPAVRRGDPGNDATVPGQATSKHSSSPRPAAPSRHSPAASSSLHMSAPGSAATLPTDSSLTPLLPRADHTTMHRRGSNTDTVARPGAAPEPPSTPRPNGAPVFMTMRSKSMGSDPPIGSKAPTFEMLASASTPYQPDLQQVRSARETLRPVDRFEIYPLAQAPSAPTGVAANVGISQRQHRTDQAAVRDDVAEVSRGSLSPDERRLGVRSWQSGMGMMPPPPPLDEDDAPAPIPPPRRARRRGGSNSSRESSLKSMESRDSQKSLQRSTRESSLKSMESGDSQRSLQSRQSSLKSMESGDSQKSLQSNGSGGGGGGGGGGSGLAGVPHTSRGMRPRGMRRAISGGGAVSAGGAERQPVQKQQNRHPVGRVPRAASAPNETLVTSLRQPSTSPVAPNHVDLDLPEGWSTGVAASGETYYVDHANKTTCWSHPATWHPRYSSEKTRKTRQFFEGSDL